MYSEVIHEDDEVLQASPAIVLQHETSTAIIRNSSSDWIQTEQAGTLFRVVKSIGSTAPVSEVILFEIINV